MTRHHAPREWELQNAISRAGRASASGCNPPIKDNPRYGAGGNRKGYYPSKARIKARTTLPKIGGSS